MRKSVWTLTMLCCAAVVLTVVPVDASGKSGEALFKEHCAACHPDGGNIIDPRKTLKKKDLEANKAASVEAIIKLMRNPGPGMLRFDTKTIPDKDAHAIAEYVLGTFSK